MDGSLLCFEKGAVIYRAEGAGLVFRVSYRGSMSLVGHVWLRSRICTL